MTMMASYTRKAASLGVSWCFLLVLISSSVSFVHVEADEVVNSHETSVLPQAAAKALVQVDATENLPALSGVQGEMAAQQRTACFIGALGRGVGLPLDSCPAGREKDGLLCYPPCNDGYHGVGPVCWQSCPPHFTDTGVFCIHAYGKGCCCTVFGCCGCPQGYKDNGCFCRSSFTKGSYGRGVGKPLICGPGKEQNGKLCYHSCPSGYSGAGPVCWRSNSPTSFPVKCNEVVWAVDQATCSIVNSQIAAAGISSAACIGTVFAASATGGSLWQLAQVVCGATVPPAMTAVNRIIKLTGATTCPSSS